MTTFVELWRRGVVEYEDIDHFVEMWHSNSEIKGFLPDLLGMSDEQYAAWVEDPETLIDVCGQRDLHAPRVALITVEWREDDPLRTDHYIEMICELLMSYLVGHVQDPAVHLSFKPE